METIKAKAALPTAPFAHALRTAMVWFEDAERGERTCIVRLSPEQLRDTAIRERVCSLAGNTPGLADALMVELERPRVCSIHEVRLELAIIHDEDAEVPLNNPVANIRRVRHALS